jgi:hypothetical protein
LLVLALALTVLASAARAAESLYVIEQLVVGVTSSPGGEGEHVATIKSGDRVEVLDRQGEEAQIQLPDGTSGWVKASYLSAELPLQQRLQDQTAQVEKLKQEVARLQSQARAATLLSAGSAPSSGPARSAGSAPSARSTTAPPDASPGTRATSPAAARTGNSGGAAAAATAASPAAQSDSQGSPPGTTARDPSPFMGGGDATAQPSWLWVVGSSLVTLALGFVAGWRVLDRRIRRKYGGLRIY